MYKIDTHAILLRLKERYNEKHDFNCICKCKDSTICEYENGHTVEIWTNCKIVKFLVDDGVSYATVKTEFCPICGGKLSGNKKRLSNGMRVI